MANQLTVKKYSPADNPDVVVLGLTVTGNYTQGTPDLLNLTPSTWKDPSNLGIHGSPSTANPSPSFYNLNAGGYTAYIVKGATIALYGIRWFAPGGAELATGAFPAAITGGEISLEAFLTAGGEI